jgi:cell cycle arrest protein BUB3
MDLLNNTLAVAMADRHIHIYDTRNMKEPWQVRDTTLKYMLKCIRLMPRAEGFACSSIEGRVALEFFEPVREDKRYAFKLHRQTINDTEVVYPVNALAFHPM